MNTRFTRFGILFAMLLSLLVSMVGCVSLSPAAKKIYMISNTQEVSACTRIGHVSAESMACIDPPTCMQAARNEGRNQAAEMGATHLVTTYSGINLTHGLYEGDAYSCANDKTGVQRVEIMTSSPTDAGCTKDIECKGDRVCEGGRCVSPVTVQSPK